MKYKYDPESDVLSVSLSRKPFLYAREMGDVVVHFDKEDRPVYLEFLNARNFVKEAGDSLPSQLKLQIAQDLLPSSLKRIVSAK